MVGKYKTIRSKSFNPHIQNDGLLGRRNSTLQSKYRSTGASELPNSNPIRNDGGGGGWGGSELPTSDGGRFVGGSKVCMGFGRFEKIAAEVNNWLPIATHITFGEKLGKFLAKFPA